MKIPAYVLALFLLLASCSQRTDTQPVMDTSAIRTLVPAPISAAGSSQWDGVIEAVQQADLTAQTGGRVAAVLVDVNDAVKANQALLRLTGV